MEKKKTGIEMTIIFYAFILICIATLVDIIPGVSASPWATKIYGIVCLAGVVYCARNKIFMAIDTFVEMYPKGLQKTIRSINNVLMPLACVLLEVAVAIGFVKFMGSSEPMDADRIFMAILYAASLVVYPITFIILLRNLFSKSEEKKGGDNK